jgi:hypothetical protein
MTRITKPEHALLADDSNKDPLHCLHQAGHLARDENANNIPPAH